MVELKNDPSQFMCMDQKWVNIGFNERVVHFFNKEPKEHLRTVDLGHLQAWEGLGS